MTMAGVTDLEVPPTVLQVDGMKQVLFSRLIAYRYIMPILVLLGILTNSLCILVLNRPRLRSCPINKQFLLVAVSDVLVCVFFIPFIANIDGCTFLSMAEAYYHVHFGWLTIVFCENLTVHMMLWLAMDRFLAVWLPWTYWRMQNWSKFTRIRLLVTVLYSLIPVFVYAPQGTVSPMPSSPQNGTVCDNGISMVVMSGFIHSRTGWQNGYALEVFGLFLFRWLPYILLCTFNFGLVYAVVKGRIKFPKNTCRTTDTPTTTSSFSTTATITTDTAATTTPTLSTAQKTASTTSSIPPGKGVIKNKEKELVTTLIAMVSTFLIFMIPITVKMTIFVDWSPDFCCTFYPSILIHDVTVVLLIFEHIIHIFFLFTLNSKFRKEFMVFLHLGENIDEAQSG